MILKNREELDITRKKYENSIKLQQKKILVCCGRFAPHI